VSKRLGSPYRSGRSKDWLKFKGPSRAGDEAGGRGGLGTGAVAVSVRTVKRFANTDEFYRTLGGFFAAWSRTELVIDCAIWKALGTETPEEAHKRSAGTKVSDKCKQLRTLIDGGKVPHAARGIYRSMRLRIGALADGRRAVNHRDDGHNSR